MKTVQKININNFNVINTKKYIEHIACSYKYKVAYIDDRFSELVQTFRDENVVWWFYKKCLRKLGIIKKF